MDSPPYAASHHSARSGSGSGSGSASPPRRTPTPDGGNPYNPFSIIHGLPYHNELWAYRFPVTQDEVVRLDRAHEMLRPVMYRGPVEAILMDPARVRRLLDIGCGTGTWLLEMAERFPRVDCVGIDFLEQQHSTHAQNVTFMRVDVPRGMTVLAPSSFDVVHVRQMIYAIPNYAEILAQAYRILRPGGILLIHEPNLQVYSAWEGYAPEELAPGIVQWSRVLRSALLYRGIYMPMFDNMERHLMAAGFDMSACEVEFNYFPLAPVQIPEETQHLTAYTRGLVGATRLSVVESGQLDMAGYDALEEDVARELAGAGRGEAGPRGPQGIVSPWGYWSVRKGMQQ